MYKCIEKLNLTNHIIFENIYYNLRMLSNEKYFIDKNTKTVHFASYFNEPLHLYWKMMVNINIVIFDDDYSNRFLSFNQPLVLTPNVTHLILNYRFNHFFVLPRCVTHITFGHDFNRSIILTKCLLHLMYKGGFFNRSIILTPKIIDLTFENGHNFNQPLVLTKRIQHLKFGVKFNQLIVLTPYLTHIKFGIYFNQPIILTLRLTHVIFGFQCKQNIILSKNITHASFPQFLEQSIILTPRIQHLTFYGTPDISSVILTPKCSFLSIIRGNYKIIDDLPNSVTHLVCDQMFILPLNNLPNSTTKIDILNKHYKYKHLIPKKLINP